MKYLVLVLKVTVQYGNVENYGCNVSFTFLFFRF